LTQQDANTSRRRFPQGPDSSKLSMKPSNNAGPPEGAPVNEKAGPSIVKMSPRKRVQSASVLGSRKAFEAARSLFVGNEHELRLDDTHGPTAQTFHRTRRATLSKKGDIRTVDKFDSAITSPAVKPPSLPTENFKIDPSLSTPLRSFLPRSRRLSTTPQQAVPRPRRTSNISGPPEQVKTKNLPTPRAGTGIPKSPKTPSTHTRKAFKPIVATSTPRPELAAPSSSNLSLISSVVRPTSTGMTERQRSPAPSIPDLPTYTGRLTVTGTEHGRTPSPGLLDEMPPFPTEETPPRRGLSVLGLGTPEIRRWIESDNHPNVIKKSISEESDQVQASKGPDVVRALPPVVATERPLSMQLTPRRLTGGAWAPSPLRNSVAGGSPGAHNVQSMLHAMIKDAVLDVRQEVKAEMVGLHLDLLRMGRVWRTEMRGAMEDYMGDVHDLQEENKRLREENERLRRGH